MLTLSAPVRLSTGGLMFLSLERGMKYAKLAGHHPAPTVTNRDRIRAYREMTRDPTAYMPGNTYFRFDRSTPTFPWETTR